MNLKYILFGVIVVTSNVACNSSGHSGKVISDIDLPENFFDGSTTSGTSTGTTSGTATGTATGTTSSTTSSTTTGTTSSTTTGATSATTTGTSTRVVTRGSLYFGFQEKFNRYYTDESWTPTRTIYVDLSNGSNNFSSMTYDLPVTMNTALSNMSPGDLVFIKRTPVTINNFTINISSSKSGSYDNPIVFYGERNEDGSLGVHLNCNRGSYNSNSSCFNLESSNYIAIDGFELIGGYYGVRAVGAGYRQSLHQKGVAVLNTVAHDQYKDPLFTGQSDWTILESNTAYNADVGDGHGIYVSNGSDWNIIRFNELYNNLSSDMQINADPISTCFDAGIAYDDIRCYGNAADGYGQGVSEFMLVESNFFHDGASHGPNFTSVRNSILQNNIIGPYARHGTSFWQQTSVKALGSSNNQIKDNIFIGTNSHILQFIKDSTNNMVDNNIFLALDDSKQFVDTSLEVISTDSSVSANIYQNNFYISGNLIGHSLTSSEQLTNTYTSDIFTNPFSVSPTTDEWMPTDTSPFNSFNNWTPPIITSFQ